MADVIIVPGRGVHPDGLLFNDPKSRIKKAVELFNSNQAKKIIMSGGFSFHFENTTDVNEADSMKIYAVSLGINAEYILTEGKSTHTLANAYFCKKLFCEPNGWKDIIVVASSDHMPRVKYVFNKVFGSEYRIDYQKSRRVISFTKYAKEMIHEIGSMRLTKKWLTGIEDGDDKSILKVVLKNRPNDTMRN
ncbi:MAG: YdcF family SAM-binding protein [Candidatus Saccharibacteria bacterium]|nr:YdcF family SAM-binding protein [Candidatus Saccharibacteria bacterium]